MTWPDPTAAAPLTPMPLGVRWTSFRVPESGNPTKPYRYLLGYAHRTGYGSHVLDWHAPIAAVGHLAAMANLVESETGAHNVVIIAASLMAGPAGTPALPVQLSTNPASAYRYMIPFFNGGGFSTFVMDADAPVSTLDRVTIAHKEICRMQRLSDIAILSLNLLTAPSQ